MDSPWRPENYNPTSACETAPYQYLEPAQLQSEIQELQRLTTLLGQLPYDPETWLCRAQVLRVLGYPELSLGDAYKARLLVEAALLNESVLGGNAMLTFGMKIWLQSITISSQAPQISGLPKYISALLGQLEIQIWTEILEGLIATNCCADYLRISKEAAERFPLDEVFPSEVANAESWMKQRLDILGDQDLSPENMEATINNGGVYPKAYPWMVEDMVTRNDDILKALKVEFLAASTNSMVARSSIQFESDDSIDNEASVSDVLGVIASKDIAKGETVLFDTTLAGVLSNPSSCPVCCRSIVISSTNICCPASYCSDQCAENAASTYHRALCEKDISFLTSAAQSAVDTTDFSLDSLLLLRILAMCTHASEPHPLDTSLLARLTPAYGVEHLIIFNFHDHIVTPLRILETLGIDAFANASYDTWVLQTIRCRIQNNKHGHYLNGFPGSAVSPLYSMFNHSCAPNVDWEHGVGADGSAEQGGESSSVRMFAEMDIKKGEELFICYLKPRSMPWSDRQQALGAWWDGDCGCVRCLKERPAVSESGEEEDTLSHAASR